MAPETVQDTNLENLEPGSETTQRTEVPAGTPAQQAAGESTAVVEPQKGEKTTKESGAADQSGTLLGGGETTKTEPKPWMTSLPKDLREDPAVVAKLQPFENQGEAIRGLLNQSAAPAVNVDELLSAASEENRAKFWKATGRPDTPEGYTLDTSGLPKELPVDKGMIEGFRKIAHQHGVSQQAAQEIVKFYNQQMVGQFNQQVNRAVKDMRDSEAQLRTEWHNEYPANMEKAKRFAAMIGGPDFIKLLNDTKLGNHPAVIRAMKRGGDLVTEDTLQTTEQEPGPTRTPGRFQYPSMEGVEPS